MADRSPQGAGEFYVGAADEMPPALARRLRNLVLLLIAGGVALAGILAVAQADFVPSVYEFGNEREFVGFLRERPVPALVVVEPRTRELSRYLLVSAGKFGASDEVEGLDGVAVRLRGTLLYVGEQTAVELTAGSIARLDEPSTLVASEPVDRGVQVLRGEIVDSKCYFGVMNRGRGKVHRACAARCISGGIPPSLVVSAADGSVSHFLLVGRDGRAIGGDVLDRVAEPVEVTGRVLGYDNLWVVQAEPGDVRRL